MTKEVIQEDFEPLAKLINDSYNGDFIEVCQDIDNAIYMLHYLESDYPEKPDIQNVCFTLKKLKECFIRHISKNKMTINLEAWFNHQASIIYASIHIIYT